VTEDYQLGERTIRKLPEKKHNRYDELSNYSGFRGSEDIELVVGSIFGIRSWDRDHLGRLVPVTYHSTGPFTPGVNLANCHGNDIREHNMYAHSCGFYGYFSENSSDARHGEINGIIEATGVTVIGSEGFRAEKAELKALIVPPVTGEKNRSIRVTATKPNMPAPVRWVMKWFIPSFKSMINHERFDRSNWRMEFFPFPIMMTVVSVFALLMALLVHPLFFLLLATTLAGVVFGVASVMFGNALYFPGTDASAMFFHNYLRGGHFEPRLFKRKSKVVTKRDEGSPDDPYSVARLRVLYPDVPIFYSIADATREFPLTQVSEFKRPDPPLPSPLNTDNFWSLK
jgi:hypothetical protein